MFRLELLVANLMRLYILKLDYLFVYFNDWLISTPLFPPKGPKAAYNIFNTIKSHLSKNDKTAWITYPAPN